MVSKRDSGATSTAKPKEIEHTFLSHNIYFNCVFRKHCSVSKRADTNGHRGNHSSDPQSSQVATRDHALMALAGWGYDASCGQPYSISLGTFCRDVYLKVRVMNEGWLARRLSHSLWRGGRKADAVCTNAFSIEGRHCLYCSA